MKNEPIYNLLNTINYPDDLRRLDVEQLSRRYVVN